MKILMKQGCYFVLSATMLALSATVSADQNCRYDGVVVGTDQGVGFRGAILKLAVKNKLSGQVENLRSGNQAQLSFEGKCRDVKKAVQDIPSADNRACISGQTGKIKKVSQVGKTFTVNCWSSESRCIPSLCKNLVYHLGSNETKHSLINNALKDVSLPPSCNAQKTLPPCAD
ncbi:MAG: hypothetical protein A3F17_08245 [Gammaproteobacteria bacterium RIFCSPHIGHO2_12_FULL_41_15]|nr:MAG: hypothetical protein A3F17_08245 [Gammaproteobacteria bacterium RIFCSPHIGHO2_12_FULL_41_15]